jgi:hypothetical protein
MVKSALADVITVSWQREQRRARNRPQITEDSSMRISLASGAALLLGGLALVTTSTPVEAGEPVRLSAAELDQVTGGDFGLVAVAAGIADGDSDSRIILDTQVFGEANELGGFANGGAFVVASGFGNANADADTAIAPIGGSIFRSMSLQVAVGTPGSAYYAVFSGSVGFNAGF